MSGPDTRHWLPAMLLVVFAVVATGCGTGSTSSVSASSAPPSATVASSSTTTTPTGAATSPQAEPTVVTSHIAKSTPAGPPSATLAELATLPVKGRAPKTGYTRAKFGPAWTDDVGVPGGHNGCDTRNDILARDLTGVTFKPGSHDCAVATGTLHDPYTGKTIAFRRGAGTSAAVQIDHLVALSDAWQTGAQQLPAAQRQDLANDPLNLQAVDGPANEQKGDGDAATWLPPRTAYRCTYVARQVAVKSKYHLWVTRAEHDAIARVLARCTANTPTASSAATTPTRVPLAPTTKVPTAGCTPLSNGGNCYHLRQFCAKRYRGTDGVSADGQRMTCRDVNGWRWEPL